MTTDRELLEDAAKSAGLTIHARNQADRDAMGAGALGLWIVNRTTCWNPLTNNSDAFQLSNHLELDIRHANGKVHVGFTGEFWCTEHWFPNGNKDVATRRAIVRAAVAMLNRST